MSTPPGLLDLTPLFAPNAELEDSTLMPPDTVAPSTHEGQQEPSKQVAMGQSNIMGPEKMTQDRDASKEFEQPETQTQLISLQEIEASSREEWLTLAQRLKTEERWGEAIAAYKQALSQEASPDHQNHSGQESSNEEPQTGSSSQSFEQLQAQALTYGQQRQWQACIETCEQALALQPTASLYKLLGDVLQLTGRLLEARRSYREALRLRPDFAEVYGNLGNLYAQERQWPRAIECFRRALRYQPQRVALHRALAGVWEQVGNEIEAVRCWHRVLGLDPASGQAQDYFSLGNRWVRLGDWSMAERYYREAIARDEQLTDAWHNLAEVLAHHQNWLSAREMYEQILQQEPQRVISRLGYARVLTKLEDWQGAMAEYHRLAESAPEQVLAQQRFAQTLKDQGLLEEAIAVYRRALTFAPNGFELRLGFAELLCEQEQWEDALPQAEAAIALNPQIAQAHYYAGRAQVARANWQAAIPYLEQAVTLDSQFFWSRYFWGEALLGLEDWQGAAALLDAAMPLNPEYPGGYCHLGQAFLELEQYSEAVQAYRQAIAFGSNDVSYSHLGLALLKLEDWDGAIDVLNRGLELKPDDEEFHWLLSQVFVEKQDWQAAIEAVGRAVALKPEGLEFNPQLKQLLCRQGPLHEAVNDWQQAVDLNRDDPQLQLGLGVALLEGEIDLERAEACLRRNLELQPNQPQGYFYLGKCSAGQGRLDEALGFYRRSWELSQSVDCGLALAEVLQQLGRWSEAIQQYRQVLLECGESGEALFGLGQALAASERPMEAVMEWRRAIGLGWNSPELYRCLAEALVSLERWDEAVLEWGRLLELQPGNALVRRQRALALIGLGRWPESAQEWQQYWQVAPGSGQGTVLDFRPELGMYGEIPHHQELSLTGDLTVEFWLRLREWPQDWTNLVGKFVSDEQNEFCLRLKNGERGQWYYGGGKGCAKPLTWVPQETIRLHQWVHIACVRKRGQSGQLYVDGVLQGEQDWGQESGVAQTEAPVRLMVSSRLHQFLDGQLSEVRVWNVARTSDEIRRGMSEKLETELGLVAVWSGSEDGIVVDRVADHPGEMKQASANGKPRPQVGVCSGELSQKAVDRADTLAQLYGGFAQVELISSQFPQSEGQVSQPIRETEIPCHRIQAEHEEQFLEQALALVLAHPYEVVHLSQPRMPNMILGLLYKLLWNARVLVDIDDEELSLVGASETLDLGMLLSSEEQLPPLLDLLGQDWTRIAVGLANCDGFRALDSTSVGEAEESLARLVAEVLAVPDCGLSDEWLGLLQRLPAIELVRSELRDEGRLEPVQTNDNSNGHFSHHRLGEALEELGRFDEAAEAYRQAVKLQPEAAGSILALSRVLRQMGRVDEAQIVRSRLTVAASQLSRVTLEGLDSADVQGTGYRPRVDIDNKSASVLCRGKQDFSPGEISKRLDPLYHWYLKIDENPSNYWLYLHLGNSLVKDKYLNNAVAFYEIGLNIEPNNYQLNLQLGKVLLSQHKLKKALVYLAKAHELEPQSFESNLNLALALEKMNRLDEAILSYQKAFIINPGDYLVIKQLTAIWESQGKRQEIIELYRDVLERGYSNHENDENLSLDSLETGFNKSVLFALHLSYPYEQTGYAVRSQNILKSLLNHGLNVLAATRPGYPKKLPMYQKSHISTCDELEKVIYFRLGMAEKQSTVQEWSYEYIEQYAEKLIKLAQSHKAMVIHGNSTFVNGLAAVLAARKLGIKSVYEIRGLWHLSWVARNPDFKYSHRYIYQDMMEVITAQRADAVVVNSEVLKEKVVSMGVSSQKITVVPNAVNLDMFKPQKPNPELQKNFGLLGKFVVGFLGSINTYEGIDILMKSVKELVQKGHEILLMVVGDGFALKELQSQDTYDFARKNIIFTGRVPLSQMPDYYSVCDLCIFPRRDDEVCRYVPPLKVLEPMAMAKPVIVSNLPPLLEMVEDEKTGLVFNCGDVESLKAKILRVYQNMELRITLGKEARNWVERHRSWDEVSQRYLGVYESLFAVHSP